MKNLINAVNFFGKDVEWSMQKTAIWLIVIQAVLAVIAISLIIYLVLRKKLKNEAAQNTVLTVAQQPVAQPPEVIYVTEPKGEEKRELTGISLDLGVVQREFRPGEEFTCEGLVVNGEYNTSPTMESYVDYTLIDNDTYTRLEKRDKLQGGVYVIKPNMYTLGIKIVTVKYEGMTVAYTISVGEHEAETVEPVVQAEAVAEAAPVVEEQAEPTTIVVERIIEKPAEEKTRELLSISLNTDNVQKEYTVGDSIDHDGLVVTAHYNVEPYEEEVTDYTILPPDMSKKGKPTVTVTYQSMTVGYQITVEAGPEQEPIQQEVVEQQPVVIQRADPIIVEEESVSSRLRYDKSFTARLIQSDDEVKYWYTDIKNELLSFKSVHGRISWKRETFKCHKDVIAKIAYRGKILCIFLPLNVADYADKYPVEDASEMSCYEDTPMMIRLKSNRRVKLAKQLIEAIMEEKGIVRIPHETVDYYMPYEGIVELIRKGLIKRDIRTAQDEAIFERGVGGAAPLEEEDETFKLEQVAPGIYVTKKEN